MLGKKRLWHLGGPWPLCPPPKSAYDNDLLYSLTKMKDFHTGYFCPAERSHQFCLSVFFYFRHSTDGRTNRREKRV